MRSSNKRVALGTGLAALAFAAAPLVTSLGPAAHAACPDHNPADHTADPQNGGQYVVSDLDPTGTLTGGVYDSGGAPGSSTSGYLGAGGSSPAGSGYVEAGGGIPPDPNNQWVVVSGQAGEANGAPC